MSPNLVKHGQDASKRQPNTSSGGVEPRHVSLLNSLSWIQLRICTSAKVIGGDNLSFQKVDRDKVTPGEQLNQGA